MFKRLVRQASAARRLEPEAVAVATDDGLIHDLMREDTTGLARGLRERRLAKRALDLPAGGLPAALPTRPAADPVWLEPAAERLATRVRLHRRTRVPGVPAIPAL